MRKLLLGLALLVQTTVSAQTYFPKNDGVKTTPSVYQAFTNATIHLDATQTLEGATLLEKNGTVIAVGKNLILPKNTTVHNLNGQHIYPSFIELNSSFGVKKPKRATGSGRSAQYEPSRVGYYWNDHIKSDYNALQDFNYDGKTAKDMRKAGFGLVNTHNADGIHRGTSVVVALADELPTGGRILSAKAAEHFSFSRSVASRQSYPSSVMGAMALIRQFYYDSKWYANGQSTTKDMALEAAIAQRGLPKIFEAKNKLDVLRAAKISKEMGLNFAVKASGQEYEILDELKAAKATLILPLDFPKAYDTNNPTLLDQITLRQLRLWNQAPINPAKVSNAGIPFAFTSTGTKSAKEFINNVRLAVKYGLSEQKALAALTAVPANILGMEKQLGALKPGYRANFFVASGPVFDTTSKMVAHWIGGKKHDIASTNKVNIDGSYTFNAAGTNYTMTISNSSEKAKVQLKKDSTAIKTIADYSSNELKLLVQDKASDTYLRLRADVTANGIETGTGVGPDGSAIRWEASKEDKAVAAQKKAAKTANKREIVPTTFPNTAYGNKSRPTPKVLLFKNATVWTNEEAGILENTDVLVRDGKIAAVGKNLSDAAAEVIDVSGKHLTSGIVDEHSHIAASSINEGGHNSSAEVSIEDVIDPDDINIFRNLAGGVTTIQILHGSANPIGGRSAIIKLKWGETIENMKFPGAAPFIKFALGENVKQSNWGSYSRFPQTRMGVEQVFVDHFQRAKEYGAAWKKYNALSARKKARTPSPRYDVEMETLLEIIEGKRFISCHSYVQSEINMMMKVAEQFGFRMNTFTHILEGYKVADKMKEHGVAASTFSDWWGYKYEVKDAIPYNGAIMHNVGVNVAFNSDSAEMSRRLNQEAAKAVKYGGVSEEDAWKFVTINPAKMLHIDDKVGSIKIGKNADLVVWDNHPLSIYAKAEKTIIDGIVYYDAAQLDATIQAQQKEKEQLIQQMIQFKSETGGTQPPRNMQKRLFHCETMD